MIIVRGVPFLLPAGQRIGISQLAGKTRIPFSKIFSNMFISMISTKYRHLTIQISTF